METTPKARRDRRRRRRLLAFLTVAMMGGSVMTASLSLAAFTSTSTNDGTGFSAGTVTIRAAGHTDPGKGTITFTAPSKMKPGDVATASVLVENVGDLNFTYNVGVTTAQSGAGNLAPALRLVVNPRSGASCPGAIPTGAAYDGALAAASLFTAARPLTATTGTETLCMWVQFKDQGDTIDNGFKGFGTTATFTFTATQS